MRYFCGTSETSDTGNTANSSDASKTSTSEGQLSIRYDSEHLRGYFFSRSHIKWPTIGTHSATKINHCYRFVQIKLKVRYQSLVRIFTFSTYLFLATILSLQVAIGTFRVKK